jgi:hypothetical protein
MFSDKNLHGDTLSPDEITTRLKWERVAEITQIKGDSESNSLFSPEDEFTDFEIYPYYIQRSWTPYNPQRGDFVREALKVGLEMERSTGLNPYRLGVIGSTDSHTALSSADEDNFHGKLATDSIPANKNLKFNDDGPGATGWAMSASGMAAVWAKDNTRADIMDAIERREVYATTGPRITVQFFGGQGFTEEDIRNADLHTYASARGIPMGGELKQTGVPSFIVMAAKDPDGANLDRIQIIKGWLDDTGKAQEKIFNVAWSDERKLNSDGSLPSVGNTVNLETGAVDDNIGSPELSAVWTDPQFDQSESAFYYARVLQIPTARHSLLDAIALGRNHAEGQPDTIQERAYTSAIWFRPPK